MNANERRELEFVIRNQAAKKHLMTSADVNYFDWHVSPAGELLLRGRLDRGAFYAHDFTNGLGISGQAKAPATNPWPARARPTRNGSEITLVANDYYNWTFRSCR